MGRFKGALVLFVWKGLRVLIRWNSKFYSHSRGGFYSFSRLKQETCKRMMGVLNEEETNVGEERAGICIYHFIRQRMQRYG